MNRIFYGAIALALIGSLSPRLAGQSALREDSRAQELIQTLKLHPLPKESGYLGIIGVSAQTVSIAGQTLAVQSQNYYMLTRDRPINYLHWLASDDTQILVGNPGCFSGCLAGLE